MREIKFRAWDKKRKYMELFVGVIEWLNGGIRAFGQGVSLGEDGWVTEENGFKHECDVVLMQYTGLKDKNGGNEIYEGDIVRLSPEQQKEWEWSTDWARCEYDSFYGYWGWSNGWDSCNNKDPLNNDEVEVIGNIYENPELLEN